LCDVHIIFGRNTFIPNSPNDTYQYHDEYNESYILDRIYTNFGENQDFLMAKGDYLQVTVKNSTPTFGVRVFSMFVPNALNATTIASSYGGYVERNGHLNLQSRLPIDRSSLISC